MNSKKGAVCCQAHHEKHVHQQRRKRRLQKLFPQLLLPECSPEEQGEHGAYVLIEKHPHQCEVKHQPDDIIKDAVVILNITQRDDLHFRLSVEVQERMVFKHLLKGSEQRFSAGCDHL